MKQNEIKELKQEIDQLEWELVEASLKEQGNEEAIQKLNQYKKSKSKPFFLWRLYFAEVFQRDNPGFDVVIGNPPYISYYSRQSTYLSEDERKVVEYLMGKKFSYQNKLEKKFGFSRAKMTRIVKKLKSKGLVTTKKFGRTNKIFWKEKRFKLFH